MNTATSLVEMLHGVTSVLSFLARLLFVACLIKKTYESTFQLTCRVHVRMK